MRTIQRPKWWEYILAFAYVASLVLFAKCLFDLYSTGVLLGYYDMAGEIVPEYPNAIKWVIGVALGLCALTRGGTAIWCAMLYGAVKYIQYAGEKALPGIVWLTALIYGFVWQFRLGPQAYSSTRGILKYASARKAQPQRKQEAIEVVKPTKPAARKAVTNESAFDNLVGVDKAIQEFKDALELPILHPELMKQYKVEPARGIILYGPPGTGKTSLARAVAEYFNVPFIYQKATALNGRYVGDNEANVRRLFEQARTLAREKNSRVIIFLDEIDSIARRRDGGHSNRPSDLILPALLEELDGFKKDESVFLIAATNRLDVLDEAILRPGRLDKHIEIGYPDLDARNKLFRLYLKDVPLCKGDEIEQRFEQLVDECAQKYQRISPADIKEICQRVKVKAAAREARTGVAGIKAEDLRKEMEAWVPACAG